MVIILRTFNYLFLIYILINLMDKEFNMNFQNSEIKNLYYIYGKELNVLKTSYPYKISYSITPYIESDILKFPYCSSQQSLEITMDLTEDYPEYPPQITINTYSYLIKGSKELLLFESAIKEDILKMKNIPIIFYIIERFRNKIYEIIKNSDKKLLKKRHMLDQEETESEEEKENTWGVLQNLSKKNQYTPFSVENFNNWNKNFMLQQKLKHNNITKKKAKSKLTGKQIFIDNNTIITYVDDGKIEEDDEDFDYTLIDKNNNFEDDVKVENELFERSDEDLDDIDFE